MAFQEYKFYFPFIALYILGQTIGCTYKSKLVFTWSLYKLEIFCHCHCHYYYYHHQHPHDVGSDFWSCHHLKVIFMFAHRAWPLTFFVYLFILTLRWHCILNCLGIWEHSFTLWQKWRRRTITWWDAAVFGWYYGKI